MATTVSSRPTLLVLFCLSYFMLSIYAQHACALSFNLSFADPRSPNLATLINCTGDAFIASDSLELTKDRPTVRYENATMLMVVDLRINSSAYNVNATVDLRSYLPEDVLVGFSAGTGVGGEQHQILSWSFSSTLEPKTAVLEPAPPPLSIVDPITSKHGKKVGTTLIAVIVPLLVLVACAAMGLLVWRRHKRKSNEASYDSDDHEQDYRAELERGVAASGPR
ncbi:hypothetical protein EJB05_42140, partial [Eragrostis curvula]